MEYLFIIFIIIIIIGALANYELAHDRNRMKRRRREIDRILEVFAEDLQKIPAKKEAGEKDKE